MTLPGNAVGAGRALTVGENELLPPGVRFFSVGTGAFGDAGALELGDGAGVSAGFSLVEQAVSVPMPTRAAAPAASAICRVKRVDHTMFPSLFLPGTGLIHDYTDPSGGTSVSSRTGGLSLRWRRDARDDARAATPQAGQNGMSGTTRSQCTHNSGCPV